MKPPQFWRKARLLAAASALLIGAALHAQLPSTDPSLGVRTWSVADRFLDRHATKIVRTADGYLWAATPHGLARYDGVRFVMHMAADTPALGDDHIRSLLVDQDGELWVGTQGGTICRRESGQFVAVPVDPQLRGVSIEMLAQAADGTLWIGTDAFGVMPLTKAREGDFEPGAALPPGSAQALVQLANGAWWTGAGSHLLKVDASGKTIERFALPAGLMFTALTADRARSALWVATYGAPEARDGGRVFKVADGQIVAELGSYPWRQSSRESYIGCLLEDARGRVWVSSYFYGFYSWEPNRGWRELRAPTQQSLIQIQSIYLDADGLLWASSRNGRVHGIAEHLVETIPLGPEAQHDLINAVCIRKDGTLWVGTEVSGIYRYREGRFEMVCDGCEIPRVQSLFEDSRSTLWVGTLQGLFRWDEHQFVRVAPEIITGSVDALAEDQAGNLWAGNGASVVRVTADGQIRTFELVSGSEHDPILGVAVDHQGQIFASQDQTGLYRLQDEHFEPIGPDLPPGMFGHLQPDADGSLWVVTHGHGLFRWLNGEAQSWTSLDGLPDNFIRAIIPDGEGNLWFSASIGILGCVKQVLLDHQRAERVPIPFWRLGETDGMNGAWTSGEGQPMVARSPDGRLWFPNRDAVAVIDPTRVAQPRPRLQPLVEEVAVDGVPLAHVAGDPLQLTSGIKVLEIRYTCLRLRSADSLRFRYRLEGLEDTWTVAGTERIARYANLGPGTYRFQVAVTGDPTEWQEIDTPISIIIVPQWWERTWVQLLGLVIAGGLLAMAAWRISAARHRRQVEQLEHEHARAVERQQSESRFRRMVEASPNTLIVADARGCITLANARTSSTFGYTRSELLGLSVAKLVPDWCPADQIADLVARLSSPSGEETGLDRELLGHRQDGSEFPVEVCLNAVRTFEGSFVLVSVADISVRKQAETELARQRTELAHVQRVATMGQLASTLAHELNQPLGAILRNAEAGELFLAQTPLNMEELQAVFADIKADDQRAGSVIERMRALLRRQEPVTDPIKVRVFLDQVALIARPETQARQTKLHLECPDSIPLVQGDRVQLQQVLLNLIINALDAMEGVPWPQRRLELRVTNAEPAFVELALSDTGPGIAPEFVQRLFEPFQTSKSTGLGMGLAISQQIIQLHGGRLWAENNSAGGATFRFTLPVAET